MLRLSRCMVRVAVSRGGLWAVRGLHKSAGGHSQDNPYYDKYQHKLSEVLGSGDRVLPKPPPPCTRTPTQSTPYPYTGSPKLDSVLKLELVLDKSPQEITTIWEEYHKTRDCVGSVMPTHKYVSMYTKAVHCPLFVYPLPRGDGLEMMLAQFSGHRCYFTSLLSYQVHGENAPATLTLTHYTELQESKGIVLMLGEPDMNCLSVLEAQYLANQAMMYYTTNDNNRYALVRQFNHNPQNFDYQMLIEQCSTMN